MEMPVNWPVKKELFGVQISPTSYDEAMEPIMLAACERRSALVTFLPVHGIVTAARDRDYRAQINVFDIVAPDGQPVRWALNKFHKAELRDRVYGPEMMMRLCRKAAQTGVSIYLYGSTPETLAKLRAKLLEALPNLNIAGHESPPFRKLTEQETQETVQRINDSGAGLVFIGLGCPKQDQFAFEHKHAIRAVQLCVGAAFDFHAGTKKMAPAWMQKRGLEWLFRLTQEPGRLWRRYVETNTLFLALVARRVVLGR